MSSGVWTSKATTRDHTHQQREQIRLEKRLYRDLRWAAEHSSLESSDWCDLLSLHKQYGKEGYIQLEQELIPFWEACQRKQRALIRAANHPKTLTAAEVLAKFSTESTGVINKTS